MLNTNCLEGMKCPECGQNETFRITVTKDVRMWDDGSEEVNGDETWDNESLCACESCPFHGQVKHFRK